MTWEMLPYSKRPVDSQYRDRLLVIVKEGVLVADTPQGVGALTCFATLPPMLFDLKEGAPLVTERKISFWRKAIAEIFAFVNGARTLDGLREWGCDWWSAWATPEKCRSMGIAEGDLGPGSYGAVFHDFPMPMYTHGVHLGTAPFNQFAHLIEQIKSYPTVRTLRVTNWIPYLIGRGGRQKAVVSPCHGDIMVRVIDGRLNLAMVQRSADMPIGVPANMIQYAALAMALAHVTGYEPGTFTHILLDAHIYGDQLEAVRTMISREPRRRPTLRLVDPPDNLFDFRPHHFELDDYHPHPPITGIPIAI